MNHNLKLRVTQNLGPLVALALLLFFYGLYAYLHPRGLSVNVTTSNVNQGFALAMVSMAQTLPVLTGGLDLSVGFLMTMINCLASELVNGSDLQITVGVFLCIGVGMLAGFLNGCVVVYGRIQPIIATLATGSMFSGVALFIRPTPGGEVSLGLSDALTYELVEILPSWLPAGPMAQIPTAAVLLVLIVLLVWVPFRRSVVGRGCYAAGSAEAAAYISGVRIDRSKLAAYTLGGLFAALGGLFLGLQTLSGEASMVQAGAYTLNSIAAVVIGGTSLMGGVGGIVGSIFGAYLLRTINSMMRVTDHILWVFKADPLVQPLFEGIVLLLVVTLGATQVFRIRNRLDLFN